MHWRNTSGVTKTDVKGKSTTTVEPVTGGSDIQSTFFEMWRQEHADAELQDVSLQDVPGDLVTTSVRQADRREIRNKPLAVR